MFCHLCAEPKPREEKVELQSNSAKRDEINKKLMRLNASIAFIDNAPASVCLECLDSLDKAYDFVVHIEAAQGLLDGVLNRINVKIEVKLEETTEDNNVSNSQSNSEDEDVTTDPPKAKKKTLLELPLPQQKKKWTEFSWKCSYCELFFDRADDLQQHAMETHNCCNAYHCTDCNYQSGIFEKFLNHIKKHHLLLPYACYKCFKKFITIRDERKHEKEHIDTEYHCPGCHRTFKNSQEQSQHQESYFKVKPKSSMPKYKEYKCDICFKVLKRPKGLIAHKLLHSKREPSYKCELCGKGFFDRYKLARHGITHSENRPYKCNHCNICFKTNPQLLRHITIHSNEKPFSCDECGQRFRHLDLLSAHKKVHTDLKQNLCPYCDKCFKYRRALNVHIGTHNKSKEYILPTESVEVVIKKENV